MSVDYGFDDDTEDEGFDDYTEDDGLDDDTEDDALDDDDHHEGCMCLECSQAELVGLATVAADDPEGYLATFGAEGLADVGRTVRGEP